MMETLPISSAGIDMKEAGLKGGTTTWTYAINESIFQFTALRRAYNNIADRLTGENGVLTKCYRKKLDRSSMKSDVAI